MSERERLGKRCLVTRAKRVGLVSFYYGCSAKVCTERPLQPLESVCLRFVSSVCARPGGYRARFRSSTQASTRVTRTTVSAAMCTAGLKYHARLATVRRPTKSSNVVGSGRSVSASAASVCAAAAAAAAAARFWKLASRVRRSRDLSAPAIIPGRPAHPTAFPSRAAGDSPRPRA